MVHSGAGRRLAGECGSAEVGAPGVVAGVGVLVGGREARGHLRTLGSHHLEGEGREVGPRDLIMTPLNGRHSIENIGDSVLEFVVVEALPPSIVERLPGYRPTEQEIHDTVERAVKVFIGGIEAL